MTMTVRELIKQLKKMPPEATVIIKDYDCGECEINNDVRYVTDEFSASFDPETRTVSIGG